MSRADTEHLCECVFTATQEMESQDKTTKTLTVLTMQSGVEEQCGVEQLVGDREDHATSGEAGRDLCWSAASQLEARWTDTCRWLRK